MEIGERIKKRREELGMSQSELAEKVGYTSRSSIAKVETNANGMTQSKIVKFASALETTPSYLMGWEDECPVEQNSEDIQNIVHTPQDIPFFNKYMQLNETGKEKADAYVDGLLINDKYTQEITTQENKPTRRKPSLREAMEMQKPRPIRSDRLDDDGYERIAAYGRGVFERKKKN